MSGKPAGARDTCQRARTSLRRQAGWDPWGCKGTARQRELCGCHAPTAPVCAPSPRHVLAAAQELFSATSAMDAIISQVTGAPAGAAGGR